MSNYIIEGNFLPKNSKGGNSILKNLDNISIFENIIHIDEEGNEYWYARELMKVLEYKRCDKFQNVIKVAKTSCESSDINTSDQFSQVGKLIVMAKGAKRKTK